MHAVADREGSTGRRLLHFLQLRALERSSLKKDRYLNPAPVVVPVPVAAPSVPLADRSSRTRAADPGTRAPCARSRRKQPDDRETLQAGLVRPKAN